MPRVVPGSLLAEPRFQPEPLRETGAEPACRWDRKCPSRFGIGRLVWRDSEAVIRITGTGTRMRRDDDGMGLGYNPLDR